MTNRQKKRKAEGVTAVILAAGRSTRMGKQNKLLLPLKGRPLVEHVVSAVLEAGFGEVIVVTGAEREQVEKVIEAYSVRSIHNSQYREGMATSLGVGIAAAAPEAVGYAILLGDMPFIQAATLRQLQEALLAHPGKIIVPYYDGQQGHPVLFDARYRDELLTLSGDVGARSLFKSHPEALYALPVDDPGTLYDVDTPAEARRMAHR